MTSSGSPHLQTPAELHADLQLEVAVIAPSAYKSDICPEGLNHGMRWPYRFVVVLHAIVHLM